MIGGYVAYVRANNAEATAIFNARGDAGMWSLGIFVTAGLLLPGVVLLLISIAISPRADRMAAVSVVGGVFLLAPTAWLAVLQYPPAMQTDEGVPLNPAQWDHVADLYLVAFVLMGAAGAILLASAFPGWARRGSDSRRGTLAGSAHSCRPAEAASVALESCRRV